MKTACLVISILLCVLFVILPIFELIALLTDLDFTLYSGLVIPIIQTVLSVGAVIALFIMRPEFGLTEKILCNLITPLSLLNALCLIGYDGIATIILAVICCGCMFAIYVKFVPDSAFKATSAVFSVLLTIGFVVSYLVIGLLGDVVTERNVTETIESGDGVYIAEISSVKGLLGDEMEVRVYPSEAKARVLIGAYTFAPISVYTGEPHETQTADIEWKDGSTLLINGQEYNIVFD